ncbi:MAG: glycosyltransferase [Candidatus Acidiferrales bacterium]
MNWHPLGWIRALRDLWRSSKDWRGSWVLIQYTALAWSRRGFPFGALAVLAILRRRGVRCAVVFHDPFRQYGTRASSYFRGVFQDWVIRRMYARADKCIFLDPLHTISWLAGDTTKSTFIPIGANVPERAPSDIDTLNSCGEIPAVAVFCLSGTPYLQGELQDIACAARSAMAEGARFRLVFLGRGTAEAREKIKQLFRDIAMEVSILGLLPAAEVSDALAKCTAMLCVRGSIYPRRGSAIAGIACGLPVLGYAGGAEGTHLAEAGLVLVPYRDATALGKSLARVLKNRDLQQELRRRSTEAQQNYFSWELIGAAYAKFLEAAP